MQIDYKIDDRVSMRTEQDELGVRYYVLINGEARWFMKVKFGQDPRHCAGGPAFVEASRKQEEVAHALAHQDDSAV